MEKVQITFKQLPNMVSKVLNSVETIINQNLMKSNLKRVEYNWN
jgi:hypothetical protein